MKKKLLALLVVLAMVLAMVPAVNAQSSFAVKVTPSVSTANVGDTIEYTVYATGEGVTALQFNLEIPEGMTFVSDSGAVPSGLKSYLGWAATDWTEKVVDKETGLVTDYPMIWTGYNDLPSTFGEDTVIMTFSCTVDAAGEYEIGVFELLPFDENYEEFPATLSVDAVTVIAPEPECEHSFTNYVADGNATCTEDGTETAKCDKCDETDTRTAVGSALGHDMGDYTSNNDATCTEDGTKTAKCSRCEKTNTVADTGSALGHIDDNNDKSCDRCSADLTCKHSFTNYVADGNATCTEDGTETAKCDKCDETDTRVVADSALGHAFNNYVADGNATCTANGTETAKCDRCDETDTREDTDSATGHAMNKVEATVTCTEAGNIAYYECANCGLLFKDATASIPTDKDAIKSDALGHIDEDGDKACDRCGYVEPTEPTEPSTEPTTLPVSYTHLTLPTKLEV